jgi:hypothetical protein
MPYKLQWYDQDPNSPYKNRGAGYYRNRGLHWFNKVTKRIIKTKISKGVNY